MNVVSMCGTDMAVYGKCNRRYMHRKAKQKEGLGYEK